MKPMFALAVALFILVADSAYALTITSGTVRLTESTGSWAVFSGGNFSVWSGEEPHTNPTRAFGVDPFAFFAGFGTQAEVTVDDQVCHGRQFGVNCGQLTLTSPGFAMPADWPSTTLFVATVPFTATGFLLAGGNRYDLTGEGTVTGWRCLDISACGIPTDNPQFEQGTLVTYTFTVPEPPSLLLTAAFALTVVGMALAHR